MNYIDILKSDELYLPKARTIDFLPDFLESIFIKYFDVIKNFTDEEQAIVTENNSTIKFLCDQIIKSAYQYYQGYPTRAFDELKKGLDKVEIFLITPNTTFSYHQKKNFLYRIRPEEHIPFLSSKEMFHIPFQKRERVSAQRYSILGLPCLYIGESIYLCWEESNRPNKFHVSRFEFDDELKILDLSITPLKYLQIYLMKEIGVYDLKLFQKYIITWPLIAACSIITKNKELTFKPEYIIPQMVLQWITLNHKYDGVKYFSTRINTTVETLYGSTFINYVFPAKEINEKGHCRYLTSKIKLTEPVLEQMTEIKEDFSSTELDINNHAVISTQLLSGQKVLYAKTNFGTIETKLIKMQTKKLSE